jgi:hypothetical protein
LKTGAIGVDRHYDFDHTTVRRQARSSLALFEQFRAVSQVGELRKTWTSKLAKWLSTTTGATPK